MFQNGDHYFYDMSFHDDLDYEFDEEDLLHYQHSLSLHYCQHPLPEQLDQERRTPPPSEPYTREVKHPGKVMPKISLGEAEDDEGALSNESMDTSSSSGSSPTPDSSQSNDEEDDSSSEESPDSGAISDVKTDESSGCNEELDSGSDKDQKRPIPSGKNLSMQKLQFNETSSSEDEDNAQDMEIPGKKLDVSFNMGREDDLSDDNLTSESSISSSPEMREEEETSPPAFKRVRLLFKRSEEGLFSCRLISSPGCNSKRPLKRGISSGSEATASKVARLHSGEDSDIPCPVLEKIEPIDMEVNSDSSFGSPPQLDLK